MEANKKISTGDNANMHPVSEQEMALVMEDSSGESSLTSGGQHKRRRAESSSSKPSGRKKDKLKTETVASGAPQDKTKLIQSYTSKDILSGRGGLSNKHAGNRVYRRLVDHNKDLYRELSEKKGKMLLVQSILTAVKSQGGRFLRLDDETKLWIELDAKEAFSKTSQALREPHKKNNNKSSTMELDDHRRQSFSTANSESTNRDSNASDDDSAGMEECATTVVHEMGSHGNFPLTVSWNEFNPLGYHAQHPLPPNSVPPQVPPNVWQHGPETQVPSMTANGMPTYYTEANTGYQPTSPPSMKQPPPVARENFGGNMWQQNHHHQQQQQYQQQYLHQYHMTAPSEFHNQTQKTLQYTSSAVCHPETGAAFGDPSSHPETNSQVIHHSDFHRSPHNNNDDYHSPPAMQNADDDNDVFLGDLDAVLLRQDSMECILDLDRPEGRPSA